MTAHARTNPAPALAAGLIVTIAAICVVMLRSQAFALHPDVGAWGVTFDMTITIPLVYYLTVVRGGRARAITLAPVFVVCVAVATRLIPHSQQSFVQQLRWVAAPLDFVTLALILRRLVAVRGVSGSDVPARIASACDQVLGRSILATVVTFEVTTLYYGLFSWRKPTPADGHSVHERSGWGVIVAALIFLVAAEGLGMHLLIMQWSLRGAWLWTSLDVYAALWLIGDYQALRLRRITLDDDALQLRFGLRATATIPYTSIASIEPVKGEWKRKGVLKVAMADEPRTIIRLHQPMVIQSIAGIRKTIDAIAILPDDDDFEAALRARVV